MCIVLAYCYSTHACLCSSPPPAGYITTILEDARVYSEHAQKKELDVADVRLAIQNRMDHSFTVPPPRDVRVLHVLYILQF